MKPDPIYRERLLRLADFLDHLPPERFDYGSWVGRSWQGRPDLSCGTTACALGWATTIPEFRALGLRLLTTRDGISPVLEGREDGYCATEHACEVVFGLDDDESSYLFWPHDPSWPWPEKPGADASAAEVAAHIRRFLNEVVPTPTAETSP